MRTTALLISITFVPMVWAQAKKAEEYSKLLNETLILIEKKEPVSLIESHTQKLISIAKPLLSEFAQKHPACKDYLEKALAAAEQMPKLSLAQLEKDYHLDGALPKAPSDCYHAKDLLVHPATVLAALKSDLNKTDLYNKMQAELSEMQAHLAIIEVKLK